MAQLRQEYVQFQKRGVEIIVIGPEDEKEFQKYWTKEKLPFIGLPDPQHRVLDMYGQEVKLLKLGRMPAQIVIDKQGIIRFAHYGNGMQDIPSSQKLFNMLEHT